MMHMIQCLNLILQLILNKTLVIEIIVNIKMQREKVKQMLQEYYQIKRMFELPLKLRLYFSTLQGLMDKTIPIQISKQQIIDPQLLKSFCNQSEQEKTYFLLRLMQFIKQHYEQDNNYAKLLKKDQHQPTINHIQTSCQMEVFHFKMAHWSNVKFKFDKLKRSIVIINSKKKNIVINLDSYILRKSKKNKFVAILQSINREILDQYSKISLLFREQIFQKIYLEIITTIFDARNQYLLKIIKSQEEDNQTQRQTFDQNALEDRSLVFLTLEQIKAYQKYKKHILDRLYVGGFSFQNVYCKNYDDETVRIDRSTKIDKIFKLECEIKKSKEEIKTKFLYALSHKYKYKLSETIMEEFSKKYKAVYDRYLVNNKIYEQISIKQESNFEKDQIFFMKGVENIMTSNYLQFLIVKVKPTDRFNYSKLVIVASLILGKDINLELAFAFLVEFRDMIYRQENTVDLNQKKNIEQDEEDFFTIISQNQHNQEEFQQDIVLQTPRKESKQLFLNKQKSQVQTSYLKNRYILFPIELTSDQLKNKIRTDHFLYKDWARCKTGGVVCMNEQLLREQKKTIKKVAASIGSNLPKILKGGVINMSLPVSIFKKQSHLQCIANNFSYAPLLLDQFYLKDSNDKEFILERFKFCTLIPISAASLAISSQKPFNPILGETLQCFIGGCPLYLQQISHHPPITAYYFQGRGYKIYGQIDPKVRMGGINSGKCCSQKPNYIIFDDGTKICFAYGRMVIKGLIFGDREFHYDDKIYIYDMNNHYFAEINFGPKKKGLMTKSDPQDYVHGKIYRTTTAYLSKFKEKSPPFYPTKDDIAKQICDIEGIWTQNMTIDGRQLFNIIKQQPFKLQFEASPLLSNSTYRKDLITYIKGDIEKAQQFKEAMEVAQRRDRKLREKFN